MSDDHIKYVHRADIDISKWDRCIDQSPNGLIYASSVYLDIIAKNWDALILGDYETVMPLTWNKKWGIKYLYQPPLTQQLGIFSPFKIPEKLIDRFLQVITTHFKFAEIFFNYANLHSSFKAYNNFTLQLDKPYANLFADYENVLKKNLKRAANLDLRYLKEYDLNEALSIHQHQYGHRTPNVRTADYIRFEKLCSVLLKKGEVIVRAVLDEQNSLLAIAALFLKNGRIYLVESTTMKEGEKKQANHFLLNSIITEFAGQKIVLDFVGSDLPGVAQYYRGFNPDNEPYFFYRFNNLPWLVKLLKKQRQD